MRRIRLSPAAQDDLASIWDDTADRWGRAQSETYVRLIRDRLDSLVNGQTTARKADHVRPGYVILAAGNHHLWCRISDGQIDVIRILHQSMDVNRHL